VSIPCFEWFNQQAQKYKDEVLPPAVKARVSIEAGIAQGWRDYVGDAGASVSLEHYGASAGANVLFKEFGFNVDNVVATAKRVLK
jgi:transketolase